mmetsp:Transcript_49863/g.143531  ORF Transcript_49863/g.143531 Transcript_49863/m.143531 type:complete len:223 (+) Transcript_49863:108-776(+)
MRLQQHLAIDNGARLELLELCAEHKISNTRRLGVGDPTCGTRVKNRLEERQVSRHDSRLQCSLDLLRSLAVRTAQGLVEAKAVLILRAHHRAHHIACLVDQGVGLRSLDGVLGIQVAVRASEAPDESNNGAGLHQGRRRATLVVDDKSGDLAESQLAAILLRHELLAGHAHVLKLQAGVVHGQAERLALACDVEVQEFELRLGSRCLLHPRACASARRPLHR